MKKKWKLVEKMYRRVLEQKELVWRVAAKRITTSFCIHVGLPSNVLEDSRRSPGQLKTQVNNALVKAPASGRQSRRRSRVPSRCATFNRSAPGGACPAYGRAPFAVRRTTCSSTPHFRDFDQRSRPPR